MGERIIAFNNRLVVPRPLDLVVTTPYFAGSIARRLRGAYTGPLIRVRRDSDNAELDIGQAGGGVLDTAALDTFCGGGDGWITTIYDQSGGGNDLLQATAGDQPQVVDGSVMRHPTTKLPRSQFTAGSFLQVNEALQAQPTTTLLVTAPINHTSNAVFTDGGSGTSGCQALQSASATKLNLDAGVGGNNTVNVATAQNHVIAYRIDGASSTAQIDNNAEDVGINAGSNDPLGLTLGADVGGANDIDMNFHESIYFAGAALSTADLDAIRKNMNAYYRIW